MGFSPPKMEHLISDYITITRNISELVPLCLFYALYRHNYVYRVSMEATNYLHILSQCGWGAHLGHHVPEELTMRY